MKTVAGQWLYVDGIEASCTIGVTERERQTRQRLIINLRLGLDFSDVGISDEIRDTVDYRLVSRRTLLEAEKSSFRLIETLAVHLGRTMLTEFPRIQKVTVEVWKPGALSAAKSVAAVIETRRDDQ